MAYSSKFVMSVLVDGEIQKEFADGTVQIPFESSYGLRLRNKHDRRALVRLYIDGEEVSGGGWVLPKKDKIDVFRPVDKDAAFRFVSLQSAEAADFGLTDNADKSKGVIEARFSLEALPDLRPYHPPYPWWTYSAWPPPLHGHTTITSNPGTVKFASLDATSLSSAVGSLRSSTVGPVTCDNLQSMASNSCSISSMPSSPTPTVSDGCTVEGARTGQSFRGVDFHAEAGFVVVRLKLQGMIAAPHPPGVGVLLTEAPHRFCPACGVPHPHEDRFCRQCGNRF